MLFNSFQFIVFFPLVVVLYYALPSKIKNFWLLLCSYFFYMCWNPKYGVLLLFSTFITYTCGLCVANSERTKNCNSKNRRAFLIIGILACLSILFYFKYVNFTLNIIDRICSVAHVTLNMPRADIVLPVGISFFTFQSIGYVIDVYRGNTEVERNFLWCTIIQTGIVFMTILWVEIGISLFERVLG